MKKFFLITTLFFLYPFQSFAEKTISKNDFGHFVDYAICKYVVAFTKEREQKVYENIQPTLKMADLEELDNIPSYNLIDSLLKANNSSASTLAETIHRRLKSYENYENHEDLLKLLWANEWKNISLKETATDIQVKIQIACLKQGLEQQWQEKWNELQQQNTTLSQDYKRFQSVAFSICGIFVILLLLLLLIINRTNKKFLKQALAPTTVEVKPYVLTERDVQNITNEVWKRLEERKRIQTVPTSIVNNGNGTIPSPNYLKGKNGKIFSRVEHTPENSFFRLFGEHADSTEVEFEFSGNEEEAIAKRIFQDDDIFRILSGNCQNAHSVKMVKPGKVKRVGEQWEVIEPISIKLI
jgi:hypothetical protein